MRAYGVSNLGTNTDCSRIWPLAVSQKYTPVPTVFYDRAIVVVVLLLRYLANQSDGCKIAKRVDWSWRSRERAALEETGLRTSFELAFGKQLIVGR